MNKSYKYNLFCIIVLLFSIIIFTDRVNAADDTIYKTITPQKLYEIMEAEGFTVYLHENDGKETLTWLIDGKTTVITFYARNDSIQFYSYTPATNQSTLREKINDWNRTKRFSRSYLDNDGDPVLELDLSLRGGVRELKIKQWLNTCRRSFRAWLKHLEA